MHGTDLVFAVKHEYFSHGTAPFGGGMLECERADTKHGWEEEVHPDKGGGGETDSGSGKGEEPILVWEIETALASMGDSVPDRCLLEEKEVSDGGGLVFSSFWGALNKVLLQVGWLSSSSSGSKFSCTGRGQNRSSTCRKTRCITPQKRHRRQIQSCKIELTHRTYTTHDQDIKSVSTKSANPKVDPSHADTHNNGPLSKQMFNVPEEPEKTTNQPWQNSSHALRQDRRKQTKTKRGCYGLGMAHIHK